MFLLRLLGLGWLLLLPISFAIIIYSLCANLCLELCRLLVYILMRFMGLELSVIHFVCEFGCFKKMSKTLFS